MEMLQHRELTERIFSKNKSTKIPIRHAIK